MTLADFIKSRTGKFINVDNNPFGAQCVELVNDWCNVIDIESFPHANAADFPLQVHPDCDWVSNGPTNVPLAGDIVVWGRSAALPNGHVAIFVSGDALHLTVFGENWSPDKAAHLQAYNYGGIIGWFHPKDGHTMTPELETKITEMHNALGGPEIKTGVSYLGWTRDVSKLLKDINDKLAQGNGGLTQEQAAQLAHLAGIFK